MSKVKMLLDVVESMRSLADSVEVLAQGIADGLIAHIRERNPNE